MKHMPFKDTNEGQTHYQNDGCGEPAHNREEGVFYPESFPHDCCDNCGDVTYDKTYPSHTAYFSCTNLKCECHTQKPLNDFKDEEQGWVKEFDKFMPFRDFTEEKVKDFITKTIKKEREVAYHKGVMDCAQEIKKLL